MSSFEPRPILGRISRFEPRPLSRTDESAPGRSTPQEAAVEISNPEEIAREAHARGLAEGRSQLPWSEAEELRSAIAALEQATRELERLGRAYLLANRRTVVDLAVAIAGRLLEREITLDETPLESLIERAVHAVGGEETLSIRVASADLETLERGLAEVLLQLGRERSVEIVADPELARGGFRVVAGPSEIDGRTETLLERIREGLEDALGVAEGDAE